MLSDQLTHRIGDIACCFIYEHTTYTCICACESARGGGEWGGGVLAVENALDILGFLIQRSSTFNM